MFIANVKQRVSFRRGQLVRGSVASAIFKKGQRTVINHDVLVEKTLWGAEAFREKAPQTLAADLGAWTGETSYRARRMFAARFAHMRLYAQPAAHGGDFSKGNSGLDHTKGSRI